MFGTHALCDGTVVVVMLMGTHVQMFTWEHVFPSG